MDSTAPELTTRELTTPARTTPLLVRWLLFPGMMVSALMTTQALMVAGHTPAMVVPMVIPFVFLLLAISERLFPYHLSWQGNGNGDLGVDIKYFITNSFCIRVAEGATMVACAWGAAALSARYGGTLWPSSWHWTGQLALAVVLGEFIEYWFHRIMHEVPWMWRFHAVHHSAPRLYWLNAVRFHPIDMVIGGVGRMMPAALLGAGHEVFALHTIFSGVHGSFQHCNVDIKLGPLNWIFSMAELHRWHHSKTIVESNNNYGGNVGIWDIIFGTRFLPKDREPPADIGMASLPKFPQTFGAQVFTPFRWDEVLKFKITPPPPENSVPNSTAPETAQS